MNALLLFLALGILYLANAGTDSRLRGEIGEALAALEVEATENYNVLPMARRLLDYEYTNPNDTYEPGPNVISGAMLSGVDFSADTEYGTAVAMKPVILMVLGLLSLFFLNIALCCGSCCLPNDHHTEEGHSHDSHEKREEYINHQKLAVFIIEMVLCGIVMVADCVCYYGYGYIVQGSDDLLEAIDMLTVLFDGTLAYANKLYATDAINFGTYSLGATTSCTGPSPIATQMATIVTASDAFTESIKMVLDQVNPLKAYISDGKTYVTDYLVGFSSTVVLVIWSFAAVSVVLFVLFRICRSTFGTKLAIAWGQVTMLIILIFNMIFMVLTQALGDFCVNPSYNAVLNAGDGLRPMVQYYATCVGNDTVRQQVLTASEQMTLMATTVAIVRSTFGSPCATDANLIGVQLTAISASTTFVELGNFISCPKFQAIWFKLINEALCDGLYSGIYSIWVSQFITSFFLFFLIAIASVSYKYFASTDSLVVPDKDPREFKEKTGNEFIDNFNSSGATTGAHQHKVVNSNGDVEYAADNNEGDISLHKNADDDIL